MDKILYYPYINLPRTDWTLRTLLYYENVGSIVPQQYFYDPERHYDPFMLELVRNQLVIPINPIETLDHPWEVTKPFLEFVKGKEFNLEVKRRNFRNGKIGLIHKDKFSGAKIHSQKFDGEVFYNLEQLGLAKRDESSWDWYTVEQTTANYLMKFLASVISGKLEMQPTTDSHKRSFVLKKEAKQNEKRETILERLMPFPEEIDFDKALDFKEKYSKELKAFKNRVEQIVLDNTLEKDSQAFSNKVEELEIRKDELAEKMKKSNFGNILFGTVCGIVGASTGLAVAETIGAVVGGLPGFANAIHSAIKIEKATDIFDQSGMKYLALLDKKLR